MSMAGDVVVEMLLVFAPYISFLCATQSPSVLTGDINVLMVQGFIARDLNLRLPDDRQHPGFGFISTVRWSGGDRDGCLLSICENMV